MAISLVHVAAAFPTEKLHISSADDRLDPSRRGEFQVPAQGTAVH